MRGCGLVSEFGKEGVGAFKLLDHGVEAAGLGASQRYGLSEPEEAGLADARARFSDFEIFHEREVVVHLGNEGVGVETGS